jgi:hypothetical protein
MRVASYRRGPWVVESRESRGRLWVDVLYRGRLVESRRRDSRLDQLAKHAEAVAGVGLALTLATSRCERLGGLLQ